MPRDGAQVPRLVVFFVGTADGRCTCWVFLGVPLRKMMCKSLVPLSTRGLRLVLALLSNDCCQWCRDD